MSNEQGQYPNPSTSSSNADQAAILVPRMIWAALFVSQLIYLSMGRQFAGRAPEGGVTAEALGQGLGFPTWMIFVVMAAGSLVGAYLIPQFLLNDSRQKVKARFPGQSVSSIPLKDIQPFVIPGFIVRLALIESVAVFGLVATQFGRDHRLLYGFVAVSAVAMILNFPTPERLKGMIAKA